MSDPVDNYLNAIPFQREEEKAEIRKMVGRAIINPRRSGIEVRKGYHYDYKAKVFKENAPIV